MKNTSMSLFSFQERMSDIETIDKALEIGLQGLDFFLAKYKVQKENSIYTKSEEEFTNYFKSVKEYAQSKGVEIPQVHGRLHEYGLTPEGDENFIKNSELDLKAAEILGAKYCIIHTPAINQLGDELSDEEMFEINTRMLRSILPVAKKTGVKVALETHGSSRKYGKVEFFGHVHNLIEACNRAKDIEGSEMLCVCVDTGHTNMNVRFGSESVGDVIRKLGKLVEALHLHDNDGVTDQHKMLYTGVIDWVDVFNALDEVGYSGWYNLENSITHFGKELAVDEAIFSQKILRHALEEKYGK